ncbi:MAG: hypothetical protein Q8K68_06700 [Nitrospirota bacterium]|nr:hypothetical protein [Nitrospirota bacterium]
MNRKSLISFFVVPLLLIMAGVSMAGVSVNVNIGPPPIYTFAEPPELVVIPNTYVYFAPGVDMDIVFYHGYWYRPHKGYWYRGSGYNGPWHHINRERVPRYIINLPSDYRRSYRDYPSIPYGHVHKNWNRWEREKYWNKRQWKHDKEEWKQEKRDARQETRQERRENRREHRQDIRKDRQEHRQDARKDRRESRKEKREYRRGSKGELEEK